MITQISKQEFDKIRQRRSLSKQQFDFFIFQGKDGRHYRTETADVRDLKEWYEFSKKLRKPLDGQEQLL